MSVRFPYRAVIFGEEHIVKGWQGRTLLTDKGGFFVQQLDGDFQIQAARLLEVAWLQPGESRQWLLNRRNLHALQLMPLGKRLESITCDEDLRTQKGKICAVAWFHLLNKSTSSITELLDKILTFWEIASELDPESISDGGTRIVKLWRKSTLDLDYHRIFVGWSKPVWLTEFRPAGQNIPILPAEKRLAKTDAELQETKAQPTNALVETVKTTKHKATKTRQPKPVARVKNIVAPTKSPPEFFTKIENAADYIGVVPRTILNWKKRGWLRVEQNGKLIRIAKTDLDKCKNRQ